MSVHVRSSSYGRTKYHPQKDAQTKRSSLMIVTSFSPTRIEAQVRALHSWRKYNVPIVAIQCNDEEYARQFTDNIIWVPPNTHWSKLTPSLVDIFKLVKQPTLLVNSDIELQLDSLPLPTPNTLHIGLRTEYDSSTTPHRLFPNKYGIDTFLLTPEIVTHLTNPLWALGIPGWDYWVLWTMVQRHYSIKIEREKILHELHKEQWDKTDHRRCSKLLEFEFDMPMKTLVDCILKLTGRIHL